jgi:hypothetical protein
MSGPVLLDLSPEAGQVLEVHIWIGVHADGREAMLSADLPLVMGVRHTPLMSSRRDLAEKFAPLVREIQRAAMHGSDRLIRVELRTFRASA